MTAGYDIYVGGANIRVSLSNQLIFGKVYKVQTFYRYYRNMDYITSLEIRIAKGLGITYLSEIEGFGAGTSRGPQYTLKSFKINGTLYGNFNPEFITQMSGTYKAGTNSLIRYLFKTKHGTYKLQVLSNNQVISTDTVNVNSNQKIIKIPFVNSSNCKLKLTNLEDTSLFAYSSQFTIKEDPIIPRDTVTFWNYDGDYFAYVPSDTIFFFKSALFTPVNNTTIIIKKYKTKTDYSEEAIELTESGGKVFYNNQVVYDLNLTTGYDSISGSSRTTVTLKDTVIFGKTYKMQHVYRWKRIYEYYSFYDIKIAKGLGIIYWSELSGIGAGTAKGPEYKLISFNLNNTLYGNFNPEFITQMQGVYEAGKSQLVRFLFRTKQGPYKFELLVNDEVYSTDTVDVRTNQKVWNIPNVNSLNCKLKLTSLIDTSLVAYTSVFTIKYEPIIPGDTLTYWNYDVSYLGFPALSDTIYPVAEKWYPIQDSIKRVQYMNNEAVLIAFTKFKEINGKIFYTAPFFEEFVCYDKSLSLGRHLSGNWRDTTIIDVLIDTINGTPYKVQKLYKFKRDLDNKIGLFMMDIAEGLGITYWKEEVSNGLPATSKGPTLTLRSYKKNGLFYGNFNPSFINNLSGTYISGNEYSIGYVLRTLSDDYNIQLIINDSIYVVYSINKDSSRFNWTAPQLNANNCKLKIVSLNNDSLFAISDTFTINYPLGLNEDNLITEYHLYQNYPNPFNPSSKIKYSIKEESIVRLTIYNSLGEVVKYFGESIKSPGAYEEIFDASSLSSGIYLYRVDAKSIDGKINFTDTKKMMLLK